MEKGREDAGPRRGGEVATIGVDVSERAKALLVAAVLGLFAGFAVALPVAFAAQEGLPLLGLRRGSAQANTWALAMVGGAWLVTWAIVTARLALRTPRAILLASDRIEVQGIAGRSRALRFDDLAVARQLFDRSGVLHGLELRDDAGARLSIEGPRACLEALPLLARLAQPAFDARARRVLEGGGRIVLAEPRRLRAVLSGLALLGGLLAAAYVAMCALEIATGRSLVHDERSEPRRLRDMADGAVAVAVTGGIWWRLRGVAGSGLSLSRAGLSDEGGDPSREIAWSALRRIVHDDTGVALEGTSHAGAALTLHATREAESYLLAPAVISRLLEGRAVEEQGDPDIGWDAVSSGE